MILNERFGQRHGGISEWMFRILNEIWIWKNLKDSEGIQNILDGCLELNQIWIEIWKDLRNFWMDS